MGQHVREFFCHATPREYGFGWASCVVAVVLSLVVLFETISGRPLPSGWPFLAIVVIFFSGGQLLILGIIGEYLGRLFLTANRTPQFVVREEKGRSVEDRQGTGG